MAGFRIYEDIQDVGVDVVVGFIQDVDVWSSVHDDIQDVDVDVDVGFIQDLDVWSSVYEDIQDVGQLRVLMSGHMLWSWASCRQGRKGVCCGCWQWGSARDFDGRAFAVNVDGGD